MTISASAGGVPAATNRARPISLRRSAAIFGIFFLPQRGIRQRIIRRPNSPAPPSLFPDGREKTCFGSRKTPPDHQNSLSVKGISLNLVESLAADSVAAKRGRQRTGSGI